MKRWCVIEVCPVCHDRLVAGRIELDGSLVLCGACGSVSAVQSVTAGNLPSTTSRGSQGL